MRLHNTDRATWAWCVLAAVGLAFAGCGHSRSDPAASGIQAQADASGSSDALGDAGAASTAAVSQLCPSLAAKTCAALTQCGCPLDGYANSSCAAVQTARCEKSIVGYVGGLSLGTIRFDAAAAADCISGFDALAQGCGLPDERLRPPSCRRLFLDKAALGGSCAKYSLGLACADGKGQCSPIDGSCVALTAVGASCQALSRCADGLVCDGGVCRLPSMAGGVCSHDGGCAIGLVCDGDGKCRTPLPEGAACQSTSACATGLACIGGSCTVQPQGAMCVGDFCGAGQTCHIATGPHSCQPKAVKNQPCIFEDDCDKGLFCDFLGGSLCRPLPTLGEACPVNQCAAGLSCDASTTCVPSPAQGSPCLSGGIPNCLPPMGCDPQSATCQPPGGDGTPCFSGLCATGTVCNYSLDPPRCQGPKGQGTPCVGMDALCSSGLHCDGGKGVCVPDLKPGATCQLVNDCGVGMTCWYGNPSRSGTGTCKPLPAAQGAPCEGSCGAGLRCAPPLGSCRAGICTML